MATMIQDLLLYQAHADACLLMAVRAHPAASRDEELRTLLHHVLEAHRFWTHLCRAVPFAEEAESVVAKTLDDLIDQYRATQEQESAWVGQLDEGALSEVVESHYFPGRRIPVSEALLQVCMHSQGHRAQCAARLRALGGEPPQTDYILWSAARPTPNWE